jgi:hypothetical protein
LLKANGLQLVKRHFKRQGKAVIASLLAGLVLLLGAMAACPALHELIHHDADKPGHECAVTLFGHGQVDAPVVAVAAVIPVAPVEFSPLASAPFFDVLAATLPPGRGPPVSYLHS